MTIIATAFTYGTGYFPKDAENDLVRADSDYRQHAALLFVALVGCLLTTFLSSLGNIHALSQNEEKRHYPAGDKELRVSDATSKQLLAPHVVIADLNGGGLTTSNSSAPQAFDSEVASGCYCFLHRPLDEDEEDGGSHARYFSGKRRLWEIRFQCTFKQTIKASSLRIGSAPYERLPLGARQVAVQRMALKMAGPMLGGFYNSPGDDPEAINSEEVELERPITSIPIQEVDQHVVTLPGEMPPNLFDLKFASFGKLKSADSWAYRKQLAGKTFKAGETHTFAYWGPSKAADLIKWQIAFCPLLRGTSLDALNGPPPLELAVYVLKPAYGNNEHETRHLESRKDILWSVAGWSSNYAPTPERLEQIYARAGCESPDHKEPIAKNAGAAILQAPVRKHPQRQESIQPNGCISRFSGCCYLGVHKLLQERISKNRVQK
jgi:hypothetical protein